MGHTGDFNPIFGVVGVGVDFQMSVRCFFLPTLPGGKGLQSLTIQIKTRNMEVLQIKTRNIEVPLFGNHHK